MTKFKPYREVSLDDFDGSALRVVASNGDVVLMDVHCDGAAVERFIECWNALRHVAFPAAHVTALEDRVQRLEQLRKDAWSRAEALQSEIDQIKATAR